jgi:hypothetical protein
MTDTDTTEATAADTDEGAQDYAPSADATPDQVDAVQERNTVSDTDVSSSDGTEPDTFPREVVEKLRQENG